MTRRSAPRCDDGAAEGPRGRGRPPNDPRSPSMSPSTTPVRRTAARTAPIHRGEGGEPGCGSHLDRDGDEAACERRPTGHEPCRHA
ncbi:excalibur calcium-binding domain-containing protein [Streptomyces litmocidini]|uniref:excalibur calcium-binding domain-containing protein n=1 Tax=Streptomyces litmocidini TaxID=67318 RepID=UPI0035709BF3